MDQRCVTIFSNDKVTQLEMLNSPHTLAPVCHTGPSLSAPPEGITLQSLGLGNVLSAMSTGSITNQGCAAGQR